jgi:hypothetical protein
MLLPEDQTAPNEDLLRGESEGHRDSQCEVDDIADNPFKIRDMQMTVDNSCELIGCRHHKIEASELRNMSFDLLMLGR